MRPKWNAPAAAACALVIATCGACGGGGGSKADSAGESFALPAGFKGVSFADEPSGNEADPTLDGLPKYAVSGTVDVPVGKVPYDVAVNRKTNRVYVVNKKSSTVTVIDGKTDKTIATVKAGADAQAVAINETTNKIYVANVSGIDANGSPDATKPGSITVIDGKTNKTTTVRAELEPIAIAINEKTNTIYVANQGSNDVTVIDGKSNETTSIKLREDDDTLSEGVLSPNDVAVNTVTNKIYVTGSQSNTLAVIDGATKKFAVLLLEGEKPRTDGTPGTIQYGTTPTYAAVDEKANKVYVANFTSNDVTVVDGAKNETVNLTLQDVQDVYEVAVNPVTGKIYTANLTSKSITVIDGKTNESVTIGDLPGKPRDVVVNPVTNKIYFPLFVLYRGAEVGNDKQLTGLVAELDGATNNVTIMIAGITPYAVDINPNTNKLYVVNQDSNTVSVFKLPSATAAKAGSE